MPMAWLALALLLFASEAGAAPCDAEALQSRLVSRGLPVHAVTTDERGGVFVFLGDGPAALAWAGRLASGQVISSRTTLASDAATQARWEPIFRALFRDLGAADLAACEVLAVSPEGRSDAAGRLDAMKRAYAAPIAPREQSGTWSGPLVVNGLALLEVLALLGLLLVQVLRSARARPRLALALTALATFALLVRVLSSARQPVGAANADFTHVMHAADWLASGFGQDLGVAYPPAYRTLLAMIYAVTGPDLRLSYWLTTVLGALVAVPAALLARRLSDDVGATFAGLALATLPAAVFFSNGVDLSIPAALLLTLSFERLLAALERPTALPVATWALSLLLFVECRLEAVGIALPIVLVQGALLLQARPPRALRWFLPAGALALLLGSPYLLSLAAHTADLGKGGEAVSLLGAATAGLTIGLALAALADRLLTRRPAWAVIVPPVLVAATLALIVSVVVRYSGNAFLPGSQVVPEYPFVLYHVEQGVLRFVDHAGQRFLWMEPGVFPLLLLVPWALSLLPRPDDRTRSNLLAAVGLLGLPLVGWVATSRLHTGIVLAEGLRLHAAFVGLLASSMGLGAARLLAWIGPGRGRRAAAALLGLAVLAPLVTHRSLESDADRNPQAEARFATDAVRRLPDGATVLLPDDEVDMRDERLGFQRVSDVFRTDHLWRALAATEGRALRVMGLSAFRELPLPLDGPVYAALGLDCARARRPETRNPSCRELDHVVKGPPLLEATLPNLSYESLGVPWFCPSSSMLRLSLVPVVPSEVALLRRAKASADE